MDLLERSIRQSHSPPSAGGGTGSRNGALRWKDHASSPIPAVANTPRRPRGCAAPCCSPAQTSFCEQASHRSFYFAERMRAPLLSLALGNCFIPASTAVLHASPSAVDARRHHHGRYEYTLARTRACSEMSAFVAFYPAAVLPPPKTGAAHRADTRSCPVRSISPSTSGARKPPSHRTSVQALGTTPR
jgi:hypothetical protein